MRFKERFSHVDQVLVVLILALVSVGFIIMSSASMDFASVENANPFFYINRQLFFIVFASIIAFACFCLPTAFWNNNDKYFLAAGMLLLILVLLVGKEINGSTRWIPLGVVNLQASEFAKIFILIFIAGYLVRRQDEVREKWSGFVKAASVLSAASFLLILEPDFGATVVLLISAVGMIFLAGLGLQQVFVSVVLVLLGVVAAIFGASYRLQRLSCFADPWAEAYDCGYQLVQSLIAFGRGEFFGLGLGKSIQKLFFLPEAHTDFVFAILAEELGFVGVVAVIGLFVALIYKIFSIALRAEAAHKLFAAYFAYGIGLLLSAQVFINIGVNSGLLPTKGLTLPLLSYGGSSLVAMAIILGILLRIDADLRSAIAQSSSENLRGRRLA